MLPAAGASSALPVLAARPGRDRHELPPEVAARIAAGVPRNTLRAWGSRYGRYHAWALEADYEQPMPPTQAMLASYLDYLGYDQKLKVSTLVAHLGSVMGVTRAWVDRECTERAWWREQRRTARRQERAQLDALDLADARRGPDDGTDPRRTIERVERLAARQRIEEQERQDADHERADPQVPGTRAAHLAIAGYAGTLARDPHAQTGPRKATPLTAENMKAIVRRIDLSVAAGRRDKALLLLWWATGRRGDETTGLNTNDIAFASPHGMRVRIRRSKTDPNGLTEDTVRIPYAKDPLTCPVRATLAWLEDYAPAPSPDAPRPVLPLWPRIDQTGAIGPAATSPARARTRDDGRLTTKGLTVILRKRATNAKIQIDGHRRTEDGDLVRVQISNHSTRRGLVTEALEAGRRIEDVAEHAGFAPGSKTIYEYWDLTGRGWEGNAADGLL